MKIQLIRADDLENVRAFLFTAIKAHFHLDWIDPLSFLERDGGYFLMDEDSIIAVGILPQAPEGMIWCRGFYHHRDHELSVVWRAFWELYLALDHPKNVTIGVMDPGSSMKDVLLENGFISPTEVVILRRSLSGNEYFGKNDEAVTRIDASFAETVELIDNICFPPMWRFTLRSIQKGLDVPGICTKLTIDDQVIGYQISNFGYSSIHLARLAVLPEYQGKGYANRILNDLFRRTLEYNVFSVSVNTQKDNVASLRLYEKFGFLRTPNSVPLLTKIF